jgi:hypothetical protein
MQTITKRELVLFAVGFICGTASMCVPFAFGENQSNAVYDEYLSVYCQKPTLQWEQIGEATVLSRLTIRLGIAEPAYLAAQACRIAHHI